jgi:hypothetical protein
MMDEDGYKMDEPGSQFTYEADRKRRLRRNRLVQFCVCIALWVVSVVPLARESMPGREGASAVAVYVAVGGITTSLLEPRP